MRGSTASCSTTRERRPITVSDHGLTVGDGVFEAVKVVDGQPFALTRHLERLRRSAAALGLPASDLEALRARGRRGGAGRGSGWRWAGIRITYTGGPAPLGSGRGDAAADAGRGRGADGQAGPDDRGGHGALAAQRARRAGRASRRRRTPRTWSPWPRPAERGRDRGGVREPRRAPVRGDRVATSSTSSTASCGRRRWRAAAWPASPAGSLLEWFGGREVDEPIEVLAEATRDLPGLDDPRRAGRRSGGTTASSSAPGPVTADALATWRAPRARASRRLSALRM